MRRQTWLLKLFKSHWIQLCKGLQTISLARIKSRLHFSRLHFLQFPGSSLHLVNFKVNWNVQLRWRSCEMRNCNLDEASYVNMMKAVFHNLLDYLWMQSLLKCNDDGGGGTMNISIAQIWQDGNQGGRRIVIGCESVLEILDFGHRNCFSFLIYHSLYTSVIVLLFDSVKTWMLRRLCFCLILHSSVSWLKRLVAVCRLLIVANFILAKQSLPDNKVLNFNCLYSFPPQYLVQRF